MDNFDKEKVHYSDTQHMLEAYRSCYINTKIIADFYGEKVTHDNINDAVDFFFSHKNCIGLKKEDFIKSFQILSQLDAALRTLRSSCIDGNKLYLVLYFTYLSQKPYKTEECMTHLSTEIGVPISRATFFRIKKEAIYRLSCLVWGIGFDSGSISISSINIPT